MRQQIIDFMAWHNRGEKWIGLVYSFIKYPVYLGALKFVFPMLPFETINYLYLGLGLSVAKLIVGYIDFKKGLMLQEAETMTKKYNPFFNKLKSHLETLDERVESYHKQTNFLITIMSDVIKHLETQLRRSHAKSPNT